MTERGFGVTRACGLVAISRSLYCYRSRRPDSTPLRVRIEEIAAVKRRYYIESFNGKFRDECLNEHWFLSLAHCPKRHRSVAHRVQHRTTAQLAGQPHAARIRCRKTGFDLTRSVRFVKDSGHRGKARNRPRIQLMDATHWVPLTLRGVLQMKQRPRSTIRQASGRSFGTAADRATRFTRLPGCLIGSTHRYTASWPRPVAYGRSAGSVRSRH